MKPKTQLILATILALLPSLTLQKHAKPQKLSSLISLAHKYKSQHKIKKMHGLLRKLLLKLGKAQKRSKRHPRSLTVPIIELLEACRILLQAEEHLIIEGDDISGGTMNIELPKDPPTVVMNQLPLQHVHYYDPQQTLRVMDKAQIPVYLI